MIKRSLFGAFLSSFWWKVFFFVVVGVLTSGLFLFQLQKGTGRDLLLVVGYPHWSIYSPNVHIRDLPLNRVDYLIYKSAAITNEGLVDVIDEHSDIYHRYPDTDLKPHQFAGNYGELVNQKLHHPNLKTILSLGGWEEGGQLLAIATDDIKRNAFVQSALAFAKKYRFDGIELDWQLPAPNSESIHNPILGDALSKLTQDLYTVFKNNNTRWVIMLSLSQQWLEYELPYKTLATHTDYLTLETAYISGYWSKTTGHMSPLYDASSQSLDGMVTRLIDHEIPPEKIIISVAPYGTSWDGVSAKNYGLHQAAKQPSWGTWDTSKSGLTGIYSRAYLNYLSRQPGFVERWDEKSQAAFLYNEAQNNGNFISYENSRSLKHKIDYLQQHRLAGINITRIQNDLKNDESMLKELFTLINPVKAMIISIQEKFMINKRMLLASIVTIIMFAFMIIGFILYQQKKSKINNNEINQYQNLKDNLFYLKETLLGIYQLLKYRKGPTTINEIEQELIFFSSKKIYEINTLMMDTNLYKHEKNIIPVSIDLDFILKNFIFKVNSERNVPIKFFVGNIQDCCLTIDPIYTYQLFTDICQLLLEVDEGKTNHIEISSQLIKNCKLTIGFSIANEDVPHHAAVHTSRFSRVYLNAKRLGFNLLFEYGSKLTYRVTMPAQAQFHRAEHLVWQHRASDDWSSQPPDKKNKTLQKLASFSSAEFSARDASSLITQACEFFCVNVDKELHLSLYQGEQLIGKIGAPTNEPTDRAEFQSLEFKFIIESSASLTDEEKDFFEVLVGQVQLARRALKSLAKEPALLAELTQIASNREEIVYLEADSGYTSIFMQSSMEPRYISMRLRNIKQYFDDEAFLQIHRSYLVNPRLVQELRQVGKMKYEVVTEKGILPVSRSYVSIVKQYLGET